MRYLVDLNTHCLYFDLIWFYNWIWIWFEFLFFDSPSLNAGAGCAEGSRFEMNTCLPIWFESRSSSPLDNTSPAIGFLIECNTCKELLIFWEGWLSWNTRGSSIKFFAIRFGSARLDFEQTFWISLGTLSTMHALDLVGPNCQGAFAFISFTHLS